MAILDYSMGFIQKRNFAYDGPVQISLSGGRSSAAMLRLLLDQHNGTLPDNYKVIFTNTGREHPLTYKFLHKIELDWNVPIIWLELTGLISDQLVRYKQVDFNTASRDGAPWQFLRRDKPAFPPRRATRTCTVYMKVLPALTFVQQELGWSKWTNLLGYRADESARLHRALIRCGAKTTPYTPDAPLLAAGIDKEGVNRFFATENTFNLEIPEHLGNCTFCFLKSEKKLRKAMSDMPGEIDWWVDLDEQWSKTSKAAGFYRIVPYGGYAGIKQRALASAPPITHDENDDITDLECNCTD